jgi:cytochrome d ubiquinol oxidase subunit I
VVIGLLASVLVIFPIGHMHAQQVARTQPAKFAAIEGLYATQTRAPLLAFGLVKSRPPEIQAEVAAPIPGLLSWMAFGDFDAEVKGLDAFPEDERPPLWLTFVSFHNMVILGVYFVLLTLWGTFQLWRGKLWKARKLLLLMALSIPLPVLACQFGWIAAEVGRQPWIVQGMLRTDQAASPAVSVSELWFSIIMFSAIYALLFVLYLFLMTHEIRHERSLLGAGEAAS